MSSGDVSEIANQLLMPSRREECHGESLTGRVAGRRRAENGNCRASQISEETEHRAGSACIRRRISPTIFSQRGSPKLALRDILQRRAISVSNGAKRKSTGRLLLQSGALVTRADVAVNRFTRLGAPGRFVKLHQIGALPSPLRQ